MEQYLKKINELISLYNQFFSSIYFIVCLVAITILILFQGKLISWFVMRGVKKAFISTFPVVNEVKDELLGTDKLKKIFTDEYNYKSKAIVYSFLAIISFIQVILMWSLNKMDISSSTAIFTMIISLIESRDNIVIYKAKKIEREEETAKEINDFIDLSEMGAEDIVKETIEKINKDKDKDK